MNVIRFPLNLKSILPALAFSRRVETSPSSIFFLGLLGLRDHIARQQKTCRELITKRLFHFHQPLDFSFYARSVDGVKSA